MKIQGDAGIAKLPFPLKEKFLYQNLFSRRNRRNFHMELEEDPKVLINKVCVLSSKLFTNHVRKNDRGTLT